VHRRRWAVRVSAEPLCGREVAGLPGWRIRRRFLAALIGATAVRAADASGEPVELTVRIHPKVAADACARLPEASDLSMEDDFPKLLSSGWVRLDHSDFDAQREFYPCFQDVTVSFPSAGIFHEFLSSMSDCPQYPFYSGADYNLQTAIFERVAKSGDATAYGRLLAKDGSRCASEMNAPLYSILRKHPAAFAQAFRSLSATQQRLAAATQYDFNLEVEEQQFSARSLNGLSPEATKAARKFNELLAAEAKAH